MICSNFCKFLFISLAWISLRLQPMNTSITIDYDNIRIVVAIRGLILILLWNNLQFFRQALLFLLSGLPL